MNIVKLTPHIWQYIDLDLNVDEILNEINLKEELWFSYTNEYNPDGTPCESAIKGFATFITPKDILVQKAITGEDEYVPSNIFYKNILDIYVKCLKDYMDKHEDNIPLNNLDINVSPKPDFVQDQPIQIRKYMPGSKMSAHEDGILNFNGGGLTALLYFNEDFDGGEVRFTREDIIVKPLKASLLIFPNGYEHEVLLVKSGVRYLCSGYLFRGRTEDKNG